MSRRKKGAPIIALDSDEAFQAAVEQSTKFLIVVDIHQGWCGPCTTMEPIYNKAFIELDRAEERLKFFTIDAEKLSAESRKGLPVSDSCKPLFVVFKVRCANPRHRRPGAPPGPLTTSTPPPLYPTQNKAPVTKVLGALAPELETSIMDNVPEAPKDEEA